MMSETINRSYNSSPFTEREQKDIANARSRAVKQAWKQEQSYVKNGFGTRDWSPEQQKEIINNGSVHGYEGHHMRSVSNGSTYDEQMQIAGDKNNIQFLEKSKENNEHLKAHGGDTRNRTNGYYDVKTGKIQDFGNNPPKAPKTERLSNPISKDYTTNDLKASQINGTKINSQTVVSEKGGGARAPNDDVGNTTTKLAERGIKPSNEDNPPSNKASSSKRGQKPSSTEGELQRKGAERGQKPSESENKSQGNNPTPRGEKPQEAPQNASSTSQTQRGTPPGSAGGEDSKAPISASSNPSDKVSASSNSAKAADDASKVAADRATPNVNGMNM